MNTYIVQYYTVFHNGKGRQYTPRWMELEAENESELSSLIAEKHNCLPDDVVDICAEKVLEEGEDYCGCIALRVPVAWLPCFLYGDTEGLWEDELARIKEIETEYSIDSYLGYSAANPEFCHRWGCDTCLVLARPREK